MSHSTTHRIPLLRIRSPRDSYALDLGINWYELTGGKKISDESKVTYEDYLNNEDDVKEDIIQIEKEEDVENGRSDPSSLQERSTSQFVGRLDLSSIRQSLTRILISYSKRNHDIGYCQGFNYICLILLCFMDEEKAFWTFCGIVEKTLRKDFYSSYPPLNGFQIETQVLISLMSEAFDSSLHAIDKDDIGLIRNDLIGATEVISARFLLPLFVDRLSIQSLIITWDCLFRKGPDALLCICHYILSNALLQSSNDESTTIFNEAEKISLSIKPEIIASIFGDERFSLLSSKSFTLRMIAEKQLAAKRNTQSASLSKLSKKTIFSIEQLKEMQKSFRSLLKTTQGISEAQFGKIIKQALPLIDDLTIARLFQLTDFDSSGFIDFQELICCLSTLSQGSTEQKLRMCFQTYDLDNSGFLESSEISKMIHSFSKLLPSIDSRLLLKKFKEMDINHDDKISFGEFSTAMASDTDILILFSSTQDDSMQIIEKSSSCIIV